jgi:hypothetical protein
MVRTDVYGVTATGRQAAGMKAFEGADARILGVLECYDDGSDAPTRSSLTHTAINGQLVPLFYLFPHDHR